MNITQNFQTLKLPAVLQQRQNNKRTFLADNNQDTFVHSAPSFKGTEHDLLKKHPELAAIIGTAVGVAVAKVVEMLGLNEPAKDNNSYVYTSTPTNQNEDTYSYYANDSSISDIPEDNSFAEKDNKSVKQSSEETKNANLIQFEYRRTKRPTTHETALAGFVNQLLLSKDYIEKLNDICLKLQKVNDSYMIDNKTLSTKEITLIFYSELVKTKNEDYSINYDAVKNIINKYSSYMEKSVQAEKSVGTIPKVGDTIELPPEDTNRLQIVAQRQNPSTQSGKPTIGKEKPVELKEYDNNGEISSMYYKARGTVHNKPVSMPSLLNNIYRKFVETIYDHYNKNSESLQKPYWLHNEFVPKQNPNVSNKRYNPLLKAIKDEIGRIKDSDSETPYKNITRYSNPDELAEIISSDNRYNESFDIHSALRLIDRFVDFNRQDISLEDQSKMILDKLFYMIRDYCTGKKDPNGILLKVHTNEHGKARGQKSAEIVLKASDFDKEAIDIFGTSDITLSLCQGHIGDRFDASSKNALISTIY